MKDSKKKGLGRGLSSLFGDAKDEIKNSEISNEIYKKVLVDDLSSSQFQPRTNFDNDKLDELSKSIKNNGLIQPIAVRKNLSGEKKYEIIAGERRWKAAKKAGLSEIPIIVLDVDDAEALELAIVENIQRENLNVIEEAKGYERLKNEFRYDHEKISLLMSKSRSHISNTMRLLTLPKDVLSMIENNLITAGQARPLIGLPDPSSIAEEIIKKKLSSRMVENMRKERKNKILSESYDPNIEDIQNKIENTLGLKIIIKNKKNNSGKLTVEYKSLEQFDMVVGLLKQP